MKFEPTHNASYTFCNVKDCQQEIDPKDGWYLFHSFTICKQCARLLGVRHKMMGLDKAFKEIQKAGRKKRAFP